MIAYEWFKYGASTNYKFIASNPQLKKSFTSQSLETLTNMRLNNNDTHKTVTLLFKTEDLVTVSNLTKCNDGFGRTGINNHTIVMKIHDYLAYFPPSELVKGLFMEKKIEC